MPEKMSFGKRLQNALSHGWNIFRNKDPSFPMGSAPTYGMSSSMRPDRPRLRSYSERSIIASIYNRIAVDVSSIDLEHVRLDENDRYVETINSHLNNVLTVEANIDQTARAFIQDVVLSMFTEGVVAAVPTETTHNITKGTFDIEAIRTGKIVTWFPEHVTVQLYNDVLGIYQEYTLPKESIAIIENPFYAVMNENSSTLRRLIRKLTILDAIDEQSGSGKLDIIIQLPYSLKNPVKQAEAEKRREALEVQLSGSKYGVGYIDAAERVTQLNRPADNNLLTQIEYLTNMLYSQLSIPPEVFNGTADESVMRNYQSRTVFVIVNAIIEEFKRKFISKTARTQKQSIKFFRDPFALVPAEQFAEMADKFTRNEILSSNEIRAELGFKASADPRADELRNKNLKASNDQLPADPQDIGIDEARLRRILVKMGVNQGRRQNEKQTG